ncbi:MAG: hypothetical protein PVH00_14445 [Gemmatimonadota bacterium]
MAYVPWVPPTPRRPASPQANELANKIGALIKDYRGYYPNLSDADVRDALRAADPGSPEPTGDPARRLIPGVLGAALAVGVVVALRVADGVDPSRIIAPVIAGVAVVAVVVGYMLKKR